MGVDQTGIDQIVDRWREGVAGKKRAIISVDETIGLKIEAIKSWIYQDVEPVDTWELRQFHYSNTCERTFVDPEWRPIGVGETWGGKDMSAYFRTSVTVPERYAGKKIVLKVYFSGDSLLTVNGVPYHGLDPFRDTVPLTDSADPGESFKLEAESYIKWHSGEGIVKTIECSHLAVMDQEMNDTYWDLAAAFFVALAEGVDPAVREFLLAALGRATRGVDQNAEEPETIRIQARAARDIIRREVYESSALRHRGRIWLCGHSHLDLVYEWPYSEFLRKIGRTHATTLRLMEEYPEYIFSQSQPLMYKEMKRLYPELYSQVKRRVEEGRWEVIGAFWVEPDCNLISGESFVRQIQHGTRFIQKEFGVVPKTAWIPDVFGNAWTMPQILKKSGLKYFVTHKMSIWNDTNPWDKSVFWWQGPDGSRIFAHVPPSHFIGTMDPEHINGHWDKFSEKETIGESLYTFGWGDGGGGPDPLMLECARRFEDFPGMVPAKMTRIEDALEHMYQKARNTSIPVHNDELYLEEHRGVHTTKARLKKLNRYCENLYRKAELFSCFANLPYPADALRNGWEDLLTNQFHDSLPGTHLTVVYHDLLEVYKQVTDTGEQVLQAALEDIATRADIGGPGRALVVFNPQPFVRDTTMKMAYPAGEPFHILDPDGQNIPHQFVEEMETGERPLIFPVRGLPAAGYAVYRIMPGAGTMGAGRPKTDSVVVSASKTADAPGNPDATAVGAASLENEFLRVSVDRQGRLMSLFDKTTRRECIDPKRGGNNFRVFEDEPGKYDAWDMVSFYEDYEFPLDDTVHVGIVEEGPVRWAMEIRRRILNSDLVQRIVLGAESHRVDFETWIDWKETHKMLKVQFYTTVVSRQATYDIAYGNIQRSTYANNSYEAARFEVPAHMWMDISQTDYGVSLLNDGKYGHQGKENMLCLTLLRSPKKPDPESDMETHTFTYSLYPHAGSFAAGATHREALDLNDPVDAVPVDGGLDTTRTDAAASRYSFMEIDVPGVTLEALKKAEDSDDIVVRVVERHGAQSEVSLRFAAPPEHAWECSLMEQDDREVALDGGRLTFVIRPYEIRTFKLGF